MATNTERLEAVEAQLATVLAELANARTTVATLTERVAFLEKFSPQVETARKDREKAELVAQVKGATTVEAFKALAPKARDMFARRASDAQVLAMVRDATPEDRRAVLNATGNRPAVVFELAPAPAIVEVSSKVSLRTMPVSIERSDRDRLREMGLPASDTKLGAFVIDGGDRRYFDAAAFDEWLAFDDQLVAYVDAGKLTVRRLPDDEARAHALSVYMHQLTLARDEQDSRLMPRLPELA